MSRRVYLLGVGVALVAGAFLLTEALLWRPGVTEANMRRVRPGMKQARVETLLGGPPKCRGVLRSVRVDAEGEVIFPEQGSYTALWVGPDGQIRVDFGPAGDVVSAQFWLEPYRPSALRRLRAWLGW
jgi:hypothetical protein